MRLIKPYYEIESEIDGEKILRHIEKAARTCYKTEGKIGDFENTKKFVESIIRRGHESIIEHYSISVRIIASRSFTHELVRHRIACYSQECISGDTKVHKYYTIKDLYERQNGNNFDKTHNKTINLKSVDENGLIIPNKFNKIFYKGIQDVYLLTTKLGYKIKCTLNHQFKDENSNFKELFNFKIGDRLFVNGRPSLLKIDDEKLTFHYLEEKLNPLEISELYSTPLNSVYKRLKDIGIFINHLNDKNKSKYMKNHTQESFDKIKNTILKQYIDGREVWNKGMNEDDHPSMKIIADSLRKNYHNNGFKEENSNWNGGPTGNLLAESLKSEIKSCELCDKDSCRFEVHHFDGNIFNNSDENLIKLCVECHNLLHHGWTTGKKEVLDIITSIDFVGQEETYDLEMKDPYHNYIADGFVVHNSTRYCNYSKNEFNNNLTFIIPQWSDITPGSYKNIKEFNIVNRSNKAEKIWAKSMLKSENDYLDLLKLEWVAQQARMILPNSLTTEIVMSCNLREYRHIFKLRTSAAAHPEMREIMIPLLKEFQQKIPVLYDDIVI